MSISIEDSIKKLWTILKKTEKEEKLLFNFLDEVSNILFSDVLLVDISGNVIYEKNNSLISFTIKEQLEEKTLEEQIVKQLDSIESIKVNITLDNLYTVKFDRNMLKDMYGIFIPIHIYGEKLANLIIYRKDNDFKKDIEVLCEYIASVLALIVWKYKFIEVEEKQNQRQNIKICMDTLSYSELEAILSIFDEIKDIEGIIIASKIADKAGITRSVIVNALRKFESARIIETRSLGMKGTYIKILNEYLLEEISKYKN